MLALLRNEEDMTQTSLLESSQKMPDAFASLLTRSISSRQRVASQKAKHLENELKFLLKTHSSSLHTF